MSEQNNESIALKSATGERLALSANGPKARRALVVEDSAPVRRLICNLLHHKKIGTDEASNGKDAFEKLERVGIESYSLILTDLHMPGMDGYEFILNTKETFGTAKMPPVVVVSSSHNRKEVQRVVGLGIDGYILKPFKSETIFQKLEALFPELKAVQ